MKGTFKDKITSICGFISAVAGAALTFFLSTPTPEPTWLMTTLGLSVAISIGIIGYFNGKTGTGKHKG
jgi:hypothetical protein